MVTLLFTPNLNLVEEPILNSNVGVGIFVVSDICRNSNNNFTDNL